MEDKNRIEIYLQRMEKALQAGPEGVGLACLETRRHLPDKEYDEWLSKVKEKFGLGICEVQLAELIAEKKRDYRFWACGGVTAVKVVNMPQEVHEKIVKGEKIRVGGCLKEFFSEMTHRERQIVLDRGGNIVPGSKQGSTGTRRGSNDGGIYWASQSQWNRTEKTITYIRPKSLVKYDLAQIFDDARNEGGNHWRSFKEAVLELLE